MADSEHNVKININGDSASAVGALSRVKTALGGISTVAASVSKALGWIHLAANGLNMLVRGFTWLKDKIGETERKAREFREEFERSRIDERLKRQAAGYDKLNKAIAETVRLEKERNDILAGRKSAERALEDADAELRKQGEIASLDPTDKDFAKQKDAIEQKYKLEAIEKNRARAEQDSKEKAADLYRQADAKDAEANQIEAKYREALKTEDLAIERRHRAGMAARGGDEAAVEKHKEADKQWKEAHDAAAKIRESLEAARKEAQSIRNRAGEMAGGNLAANMKAQAATMQIENERREKAAKEDESKRKEDEEKAKEETKRKQKLEDARLERQKQEDLAALDPKAKDYEFQRKEVERLYATRAAEDKVARADNATDKMTAEEELKALGIKNAAERRGDLSERELRQADDAEQFADRVAAAEGVSQNRLTAMGLGSGVQSDGGVASNVMKLVDLLRQNVEATKNINVGDGDGVGVYGE